MVEAPNPFTKAFQPPSCVLFGHYTGGGPVCIHCDTPAEPPKPPGQVRPGAITRTRGLTAHQPRRASARKED